MTKPAARSDRPPHGAAGADGGTVPGPTRLTGGDAVRLHLTLAAGLTLCVGAFAFELYRALSGNAFSWMYVFEWPLFGGFAIYMWWSLLHGHDRHPRRAAAEAATGPDDSGHDEDLAAWRRYLRDLEATDADAGNESDHGDPA